MEIKTKIFGIRTVIEAIKSDKSIDKVFLQKGINNELFSELEQLLRKKSIKASYVPVEKLNRLTDKNHQGVVASISPIEFYEIEEIIEKVEKLDKKSTYLLLDQISDVRNFGAIIRSAECTAEVLMNLKIILSKLKKNIEKQYQVQEQYLIYQYAR